MPELRQIGNESLGLGSDTVPNRIELMPDDPVEISEQRIFNRQIVQIDLKIETLSEVMRTQEIQLN